MAERMFLHLRISIAASLVGVGVAAIAYIVEKAFYAP
jgi:hypothetical protein